MLAERRVFSRSTLATRLYETLKGRILDGEAPQGSVLDETLLGKYFEVSRNVVRDAILKLTESGLVTKSPHKPAFVRVFTEQDVSGIFDVRLVLELLAIDKGRFDGQVVSGLQSILVLEREAVDQAIIKNYVKVDNALHATLIGSTGNNTLIEFFQLLSDQIQLARVLMTTRRPERMEQAHGEHKELVLALSSGDIEHAKNVMKGHIESARLAAIAGLSAGARCNESVGQIPSFLLESTDAGQGH